MAERIPPPELRCHAHSQQTGAQCKKTAIPGGTVCRYHGGAAPQVQRAAAERIRELRDKAADLLLEQLLAKALTPRTSLAAVHDLTDLLRRMENSDAGSQAAAAIDKFLDSLRDS